MTPAPRHPGAAHAARYAHGTLPEPAASALETHVETCGACAALVSAEVRRTEAGPALAAVRAGLLAAVARETTDARPGAATSREAPSPRAASEPAAPAAPPPARTAGGRFARRRGTSHGLSARPRTRRPGRLPAPYRPRLRPPFAALLAVLRPGWWLALVLVPALCLLLGRGAGNPGARVLLVACAPLLPLAGVALAYGPGADPAHEIALASPRGGLRLFLLRAAVVCAVSVPLLATAGALLPRVPEGPGAAAWLLPALALTLVALGAGPVLGPGGAAAAAAAGWGAALLLPGGGGGGWQGLPARIALVTGEPAARFAWLLVAVLAALAVLTRREHYHRT
ncbi:zf-HC2 domain-containing protein [Streptomyces sp. NPDC088923]|uniref:zf-HC2 domain-containing protein n=1 Tax=Streptomyces sp. NPDC088923 TaxID=3365913 RepID=UPI00380A42CF